MGIQPCAAHAQHPVQQHNPYIEQSLSQPDISERIAAATSKKSRRAAVLMLQDGTSFRGFSCGAQGEATGEVCFNTSLEGYLEVITDPSYAGQLVTMTYPQIGNYGVNFADVQSRRPALRGLVVHDMCRTPSSWRSEESLPDFLEREGIVAIEGIDTRALVRHIRDFGAQTGIISTVDADEESLAAKVAAAPSIVGQNMVRTVSRPAAAPAPEPPASHDFAVAAPAPARYKVVAYDCGVKESILYGLERVGCDVVAVPWDTPAEDVLAMEPDGVFLSNGPGDPDAVDATYEQAQLLIGRVPVFGICLGHQMISLASGARMEKLKFGHRGGNQPVMNLLTRRVEITAQNHGFGLLFDSLGPLVPEESGGATEHPADGDLRAWVRLGVAPVVANERFGRIRLTHVNLNDGTCEGIQLLDARAFSVQYHPEASPGPTDAHYLFTAFTRLMDGDAGYLDIDISKDRLAGWRFGSATPSVDGEPGAAAQEERDRNNDAEAEEN